MASVYTRSAPSSGDQDGGVDEVVLIAVKGLRIEDSDSASQNGLFRGHSSRQSSRYYFADMYHLEGKGFDSLGLFPFDAGFSGELHDRGFLSPAWFEGKARTLLDQVRELAAEGGERRLVFYGENFGGVIVKRALAIADSEQEYSTIQRDTCACILLGVPHKAPSLQEWGRLLTAMVIPFWQFLPDGFQRLTQSSLPEFLARISSDFVTTALGRAIVSVCQSSLPGEGQEPAIIGRSCGVLNVSHEHVLVRKSRFSEIARFDAHARDGHAERLFRIIKDAASVAPESRSYIRTLARLSPYSAFPGHEGTKPVLDPIMDVLKKLPHDRRASAVVLYADGRVGKRTLAKTLFEQLLCERKSTEHCTYFAFNARDHRRRSVTSMLASTVSQLLSNEPAIANKFLAQGPDHRPRWTEGQLWIQLSAIIRRMQDSSIHLVIDSVHECETDNQQEFLRQLLHLRFATPGRLTIWVTSTPGLRVIGVRGEEGIFSVDIGEMTEFETCLTAFRSDMADTLASESPKLMAAKDQVEKCLDAAEGFFHMNLIAHRIRGISSLSRLDRVSADLGVLGQSWKESILAMVDGAPPWAAGAVSWILFARRPLKLAELAVAVALAETPSDQETHAGLDECSIPCDIEGDMRRQLGPLVTIGLGEIRIAHSYVAEVLQEWIESARTNGGLSTRAATKRLLEYLHHCLAIVGGGTAVRDGRAFALFEYALEHWHVHYRNIMDDYVRPESLAEHHLEQLASNLFGVPGNLSWLASEESLSPVDQRSPSRDSSVRPVCLAARLGLYDIFTRLLDSSSDEDRLYALQVACRNGHLAIVKHVIKATGDFDMIESLLSDACERGDERVADLLINQLQTAVTERKGMSPRILITACSIGHMPLAGMLIGAGADVDAHSVDETPPLHAAIEQGHVDIVDLLLRHGADVNCLGGRDWTPLQCSIDRGYPRISARLLEEHGLVDDMNEDNLTSAHLAARLGDVNLLERVIDLPRPKDASRIGPEDGRNCSRPLHEAAANGHLKAVKLLLERTGCINERDSEGRTALFLALTHNRVEVVDYLLTKGAAVTSPGISYSESALKQAIIHGNLAATIMILEAGEDANGSGATDSSPLTDAARADHVGIVYALLNNKADIDRRVENGEVEDILDEDASSGWAVIHFAAYYGSVQVMPVLLDVLRRQRPESVDAKTTSGHTALHLAVSRENADIVGMLLAMPDPAPAGGIRGRTGSIGAGPTRSSSVSSTAAGLQTVARQYGHADVNAITKLGRTPLHIAAANNTSSGLTRLLLAHGANVRAYDSEGRMPLHFAALFASSPGGEDIVLALLQGRADPAARDVELKTPLHYAAMAGSRVAATLLLRAGSPVAPVGGDGLTPLDLAAHAGFADVVAQLLEQGANVTATGRAGYTALHAAAFFGYDDVVETLLKAGASPSAADDKGNTPLHEAARRGHHLIVHRLIEAGANLNPVNSLQNTPLQRAVLNRWTLAVAALLEAGADPNVPDEDGDTALTAAMYKQAGDIVDVLLKRDEDGMLQFCVDVNFRNRRGKTALMLAVPAPWLIKRLLDAGADGSMRDEDGRTYIHHLAAQILIVDGRLYVEAAAPGFLPHEKPKAILLLRMADNEGLTPVHAAARFDKTPMLTAFREYGADVMAVKDRQGRTAMHHAAVNLGREDFEQVFGEFLRPHDKNKVNVPDADGWTPLHWACKGSNPGVAQLLLAGYKHPIRALRYPCARGWTAMDIAVFHGRVVILELVEKYAIAMDPEWGGPRAPWPPVSADEAFQGRDDGRSVADVLEELEAMPRPSRAPEGWEAGVRSGLRWDGKRVVPGAVHEFVRCDDCQCMPIHGIRFKCRDHADFDLCFKCYWHREKTHYPPGHKFEGIGPGPLDGPILMDPPDPQQPEFSPPRRAYSSHDLDAPDSHLSLGRPTSKKKRSRSNRLSRYLAGVSAPSPSAPTPFLQSPGPASLPLPTFIKGSMAPPGPASFSGALPRPVSWAEGGRPDIDGIPFANVSPVLRESGRDGRRVSEGSIEVVRGPQVVVTVVPPGTGEEVSAEGGRMEKSEMGRGLGINGIAQQPGS